MYVCMYVCMYVSAFVYVNKETNHLIRYGLSNSLSQVIAPPTLRQ